MAAKLEFETNITVAVRFPFGGQPKDPEPSEYGSYYYGVEVDGERMGLYATELLHGTILDAQIPRNGEATITKGEGKVTAKDGKRRTITIWKVEHGSETFTSDGQRALPAGRPDPKPLPPRHEPTQKSASPDGPVPASTAEAPPPSGEDWPTDSSDDQTKPDLNGHTKPAMTFRQACRELACLYWKAGKIAAHTSGLLGEPVSACTFFIELRRMGQRPDEDAFKDWMTAKPKGTPPAGAPTAGHGSPSGSNPIGAEGYFALLDSATEAKVDHVEMEEHMAQEWRRLLKVSPKAPLPRHGENIDFSKFPEALANDVALWIEDRARERAESQEVPA